MQAFAEITSRADPGPFESSFVYCELIIHVFCLAITLLNNPEFKRRTKTRLNSSTGVDSGSSLSERKEKLVEVVKNAPYYSFPKQCV